ncbi:hypothetical protein KCU88_g6668, partial [Aureobasidium melanogenum]
MASALAKSLGRLSREAIIDLVLSWLKEPGSSTPYLLNNRKLFEADEEDYLHTPAETIKELEKLYRQFLTDKSNYKKQDIIDRIVDGDWRRGLSLHQHASIDFAHLEQNDNALRWTALKLVPLTKLQDESHEEEHTYSSRKRRKLNHDCCDTKYPQISPRTFVSSLRAEISPLVKAHFHIHRMPALYGLTIIRLYITPDAAFRPRSSKIPRRVKHATDAGRVMYIALPDSCPFVPVGVQLPACADDKELHHSIDKRFGHMVADHYAPLDRVHVKVEKLLKQAAETDTGPPGSDQGDIALTFSGSDVFLGLRKLAGMGTSYVDLDGMPGWMTGEMGSALLASSAFSIFAAANPVLPRGDGTTTGWGYGSGGSGGGSTSVGGGSTTSGGGGGGGGGSTGGGCTPSTTTLTITKGAGSTCPAGPTSTITITTGGGGGGGGTTPVGPCTGATTVTVTTGGGGGTSPVGPCTGASTITETKTTTLTTGGSVVTSTVVETTTVNGGGETSTVTLPASTVVETTTVNGGETSTVTLPASTVVSTTTVNGGETSTVTLPASTVVSTTTVNGGETSTVTLPASTVVETTTINGGETTVTRTLPGSTVVSTVTAPGQSVTSTVTETTTVKGGETTVTLPGSTVVSTVTGEGSTVTSTVTETTTVNGGGSSTITSTATETTTVNGGGGSTATETVTSTVVSTVTQGGNGGGSTGTVTATTTVFQTGSCTRSGPTFTSTCTVTSWATLGSGYGSGSGSGTGSGTGSGGYSTTAASSSGWSKSYFA